jgi:hypothetical protein
MKRLLVACAVLATLAQFGGPIAGRVARTFGSDCVMLDVLPDVDPGWHLTPEIFRAPCLGLCPDLGSAE